MNPLTNVKNITKLNEIELSSGSIHKKSWHDMYKESAWIFVGGLEYGLTEGDILAVFSQYGEIVNINLVRDKKSGKSKGFCFICYTNQKSTVLAVDNFNGIKLCNRTIRVDHVSNYKPPKEDEKDDKITKMLKSEGCAPKVNENVTSGSNDQVKKNKSKKEKKKKKKNSSHTGESDSETQIPNLKDMTIKEEKHDPGYDKYDTSSNKTRDIQKRKHQERNYEQSLSESSHSCEKSRLKNHQQHHKTGERDNIQSEDNFMDKERSKERSGYSSDQCKKLYKLNDNEHASSPKKRKRDRSGSFSDESSRNHKESIINKVSIKYSIRHKVESSKHLNSKRYRDAKHSSSSSSDNDSSSQSSADDERLKKQSKNSKKDKYKSYDEKKSLLEKSRNKYDYRSENSDYISSKSGHCNKAERYSEHRSKNKYRNDEKYDTHHKDSYKNKQNKK